MSQRLQSLQAFHEKQKEKDKLFDYYNHQKENLSKQNSQQCSLRHNPSNNNKSIPKFLSSINGPVFIPSNKQNLAQDSFTNYTTLLASNNKSYQQEILFLKKQNSNLKLSVQNSLSEIIKIKTHYQEENSQLKIEFNRKINELLNELKQILYQKENVEQKYKALVQEIQASHYDQLKSINFKNEQNYKKLQLQIEKLTHKLKQVQLTGEKSYFQNSQAKLKLIQELDGVNFQLTKSNDERQQISNICKQQQKKIRFLQGELANFKVQKQQIQMTYYQKQQQKNAIIIELKQSNKSLIEASNELQKKTKQLDGLLKIKSKQLQKILQLNKSTQSQLTQKSQKFSQLKYSYDQLKNEKTLKQQQLKFIIQTTQKEAQNLNGVLKNLQKQYHILQQKFVQKETNFQVSQRKLYQALEKNQGFAQELSKYQQQILKFGQICQKYKKQNTQLIDEVQSLKLSQKSAKEKIQLQQNHIKTLEQIISQLKNKQKENLNLIIDQQNNLNIIKREAAHIATNIDLKNQNELYLASERQTTSLKLLRQEFSFKMQKMQQSYEIQIQKILQELSTAQAQIKLTQQRYKKQIEKLMRTYQTLLHQKDQNFSKRLRDLQCQMTTLQKNKSNSKRY